MRVRVRVRVRLGLGLGPGLGLGLVTLTSVEAAMASNGVSESLAPSKLACLLRKGGEGEAGRRRGSGAGAGRAAEAWGARLARAWRAAGTGRQAGRPRRGQPGPGAVSPVAWGSPTSGDLHRAAAQHTSEEGGGEG